ncbi:MAG: CvpA family protein [Anaerolineae bacterium]
MIQLSTLLWGFSLVFGVIGYMRGLSKELISLAGIVLALFALFQFDSSLRGIFLANVPGQQKFIIQSIIFLVIVFFAYQTRALSRRLNVPEGRDNLQATVLGAIVGFINGYLIFGSLWYFMDINQYPLTPFIEAPLAGSTSAAAINTLPLYLLAGGPGGDGSILSFVVIVLFIFVLVLI